MFSSSILVFLIFVTSALAGNIVSSIAEDLWEFPCPEDQYVYIADGDTTVYQDFTVLGNESTKYWASLYAAGHVYCEYKLDRKGATYHDNVAIAKRGFEDEYLFARVDAEYDLLKWQASLLKHGSNNDEGFKWAVLPKKAEVRKAEFVEFPDTDPCKALYEQVGYSPNLILPDFKLKECKKFMKLRTARTVDAANLLMMRTRASIPQGVYYGALLFSPDMKFVMIRSEYLKHLRVSQPPNWTYEEIRDHSEYPLYTSAETGRAGVCGHEWNDPVVSDSDLDFDSGVDSDSDF